VEGLEETDRIQRSFCKKALRIPTRDSKGKQNWSWPEKIRGGEILSLADNYSCRVRQMNIEHNVRVS
jgi:hypothetical protein